MNRIIPIAITLCLSLSLPCVALAAPAGQGYTPPRSQTTVQMHTGATVGQGSTMMGRTTTTMQQSTGVGTSLGTSSSMRTSSSMGTSSSMYSPSNVAPVVPRGAVVMNRVTGTAGTTVMYNANGVMYRVTYAPNGTYRYTAGAALAPMQTMRSSLSAGTSMRVAGGAAPVTRSSGITLLPTTGGGAPAASLTLPLLLALILVGLGLATRRLSSHMR